SLVETLLYDRPRAGRGQHERMQVDLKAVGDRVVVDARSQPARANERVAVQTQAVCQRAELRWSVPRMPAASATDVDAQLRRARIETPFEGTHHRRRDARRMPVHAHDRAEGLEPEGIAQPRQELSRAVMLDDGLGDAGAERGHAL